MVAELTPHYGADCPVAIVFRASWPDERVLRGTLADHRGAVAAASPMERTALILVGPVLAQPDFREQRPLRRRLRPPLPDAGLAGRRRIDAQPSGRSSLRNGVRATTGPPGRRRRSRAPSPRARERLGGGRQAASATRAARRVPASCVRARAPRWRRWRSASPAPAPRRRRPRAPARASQPRSTLPRRECRSSRPCPSLVILAKPPATVTLGTGWRRRYFSMPPAKSPMSISATSASPCSRCTAASDVLARRARRHGRGPWRGRRRCPRWMVWIQAAQE